MKAQNAEMNPGTATIWTSACLGGNLDLAVCITCRKSLKKHIDERRAQHQLTDGIHQPTEGCRSGPLDGLLIIASKRQLLIRVSKRNCQ